MVINGAKVQVSWDGDAVAGLKRAAALLEEKGYTLEGSRDDQLRLKFKGAFITTDPNKMRHSLTVDVAGSTWTFHFSTGIVASYWTEEDIAWAQARAQAVVDAL